MKDYQGLIDLIHFVESLFEFYIDPPLGKRYFLNFVVHNLKEYYYELNLKFQ